MKGSKDFMQKKPEKAKNTFAAIIAVQFICVLVLIAGVLCVKYFSPEAAGKIKVFFKNRMCEQTSADELLSFFDDKV